MNGTDAYLDSAALDEKVANYSYEEARVRLVEIVSRLEQGNIPLEEALTLWELGEALARRCESWLNGARERLAAAQERTRQAQAASESGAGNAPAVVPAQASNPTTSAVPAKEEQ